MPISYTQIPANIRVPLFWAEVDGSMAGIPTVNLRGILCGTMLAGPSFSINAATWTTGNATITTSAAHGVAVGGKVTISGVNPVGYNGSYTAGTGTTGSTLVVPIPSNPGTYVSGGTVYVSTGAVGTAVPNVPIPIGSQAMAEEFFGPGSELAQMFRAFYANNFANEVWGFRYRSQRAVRQRPAPSRSLRRRPQRGRSIFTSLASTCRSISVRRIQPRRSPLRWPPRSTTWKRRRCRSVPLQRQMRLTSRRTSKA